jgi:hypothetical protein
LDLLLGDGNEQIKSEALPSFLVVFYITTDSNLEDKILEVIMRSFSQTAQLLKNLSELEVLFDENDINPYIIMKAKI